MSDRYAYLSSSTQQERLEEGTEDEYLELENLRLDNLEEVTVSGKLYSKLTPEQQNSLKVGDTVYWTEGSEPANLKDWFIEAISHDDGTCVVRWNTHDGGEYFNEDALIDDLYFPSILPNIQLDEKSYKIRIANGEFWTTETYGNEAVDEVFLSLTDAISAGREFLNESSEGGLDYSDEDVEIVTFINDKIVNVDSLVDVIKKDHEIALGFANHDYVLTEMDEHKKFSGKIIEVTDLHVVQNLGRVTAIHEKVNLNREVVKNEVVSIVYDNKGLGLVESRNLGQDVGSSR